MFGGIGGFRHGLEQSSDRYECVDYIEYDEYAVKAYNAIFQEQHEPKDVTQLDTEQISDHDLLCGGFPCQAFSIAGNRKGTDEARGQLFREIVRIARAKKPEMLLLENVKGILSQKAVTEGEAVEGTKGHAFREVLASLHELGYCLEWQVLNSKHWGVPQNRERVFIIGHLGGEPRRKVFPITREDKEDLGEDRGENITHPTVTEAHGRGGSSSEYLNSLKTVAEAEGLNTTESGESFCIDSSYWKGTSPGDIGKGRRTHIIKNHRNREIRDHGQESPTINKIQGGGQEPMVAQIPRGENNGGFHAVSPTVSSNSWHENKFLQLIPTESDQDTVYSPDGRRLSKHYDYDTEEWYWEYENYNLDFTEIPDEVRPCLTPGRIEKRQNGRRMKEADEPMFTLTGQDIHGVLQPVYTPEYTTIGQGGPQVKENGDEMFTLRSQEQYTHGVTDGVRIRKLTPLECWRLQGFPDSSFEKAREAGISDTQLYKQAGNAVTVPVIKALGEELLFYFEGEEE